MAPRAYWKGSLKLSLMSCPVALYQASTATEKTRFHMINRKTGNRLKQQMIDAETGDVVESDQKGRGYELKKGEYVEIEREELEAVQIESNRTIDIDSFVPREEIDRRYLSHPYYIVPDGKAGIDAFAVIRDAMTDKDRVALASHILNTKAAHFDPSKFRDEYENALKTLVRRKASGKTIKVAEPEKESDNVVNLMDALKASLKGKDAAKPRAPGSRRAPAHRATKKTHRSAARARKAG